MNMLALRLSRFRNQLATLWRAFWHPSTPLYLKLLMVAVTIYILSPADILPDVFFIVGWIDDALLIAFAVNWILARLPEEVFRSPSSKRTQNNSSSRSAPKPRENVSRTFTHNHEGPTINGTSRRL